MRNILHSQAESGKALEHLAQNLRRLRLQAGLSQEELAKRSDLSRRMVNGLEAGTANISLSNLDNVAAALGVTFVDLVRPALAEDGRIRALLWEGKNPASRALLLGAAPATRQVELWSWSLAPGDRYDAEPDGEGFHEMISVLQGELDLALPNETKVIPAGEFIVFSSAQQYSYINKGAELLRFIRNVVS